MSDRIKLFLPYRGEFGHKIMWHMPFVYGYKGDKIVACEFGEEALFPNALDYIFVPRKKDQDRREWSKYDDDFRNRFKTQLKEKLPDNYSLDQLELVEPLGKNPENTVEFEYFIPKPVRTFDINCDIAVCPRARQYGHSKNWAHWPELIDSLKKEGFKVFACGAPDSSKNVDCDAAWKVTDRYFTDATLEAFHSAKLVVATDNGLAHLAVQCGKPLLMITHQHGLTAPKFGLVKMHRFRRQNHTKSPIKLCLNSWFDPSVVLKEAKGLCNVLVD